MAKKHKTSEAEQEMLAVPAGIAVATEPPVRQDWPEATETRELSVTLTEPEINETARELVDHLREVESLSRAKKASAEEYKEWIEMVEEKISKESDIVKSGKDRREVPCRWAFQTNGVDANGEPIYHSELKTLFREDTGEVVETKPITFEDRQVNLPLDDGEALELNLKAISDAGFTLREAEDDEQTSAAFVLVSPFDVVAAVDGDCMAEAAAAAVRMLPAKEAQEEEAA